MRIREVMCTEKLKDLWINYIFLKHKNQDTHPRHNNRLKKIENDEQEVKAKDTIRGKEKCFITIKGTIHHEAIILT